MSADVGRMAKRSRQRAPVASDAGPAPLVTKTADLRLRASPALKARIEAEAARQQMTVSAWITWLAERELGEVDMSRQPRRTPEHRAERSVPIGDRQRDQAVIVHTARIDYAGLDRIDILGKLGADVRGERGAP